MGLFDNIFRTRHKDWDEKIVQQVIREEPSIPIKPGIESDERIQAFSNKEFLFNGDIKNININAIIANPQANIQTLWQLCYLYSNYDPIVHGIIFNVMIPFLNNADYYLSGTNKKTIKMYEDYYKDIRLKEKLESIITELCIFGCSFVYIYNGQLITLPHNKIRISNIAFNGVPVVEFNCTSLREEMKPKAGNELQEFVDTYDKEKILEGYPPEIRDAIHGNKQWAQLNYMNCFPIQLPKNGWERYNIPWICSALSALQRKEYVKQYEISQLELGCAKVVFVRYGDEHKGSDILPDSAQLNIIRKIFTNGFRASKGGGNGLVVTNHLAKAEILNKDISDLYQWNNYSELNDEICAAAGVSNVIVNGVSEEGSSFSTAQVSTNALEGRLVKMLEAISELMNRLNIRFSAFMDAKYNLKEKDIPRFVFKPISMVGSKALREEALTLYKENVLSRDTLLTKYGYNSINELEQINKEPSREEEITKKETEENSVGRPSLDESERNSPIENSITGNPESKIE